MNIKLTDPKLFLTFEGNDLEPGHSTSQTIESDFIINYSFSVRQQYLSSLKSASDQIGLQIKRKCASIEDIIATDGNIKAVLKDGEETIFTGYIATSYKWTVTDHGERTLAITIEGVGTRLLNQPFIETGKHFFDCSASAAVYTIVHPLGITIHEGDERKILQNVGKEVEAGDTCRDLLDALFYECNAVYWFNNLGELCVDVINPSTVGVQTIDSADLYVVGSEAVTLSKSLRAYKGARITYKALGSAGGYLVYRNTTGATATRVCNLELKAGEYFDGAGIYTAAEWSDITADTFREPTLIGAVNAASESQIVGSGKIVNISNLSPDVVADTGIDVTFEASGGPYIKMLAHNTTGSTKTITRMDLYADVVYEMSDGVIRTQIDGSTAGKTLLEENLTWIHDKENASKHANLVSQYFQYASASYTFRTKKDIAPGSVIRLHEDLYSGLNVYVLITARDLSSGGEIWKYTAVGISNFDLSESAYHGTTEPAKQSGAQGPAGEPGASTEVQYAIGQSIVYPPTEAMQWGGEDMLWNGETMLWSQDLYSDDVPDMERGKYIWMRTRVGDSPWQYSRLTGSTAWDPRFLGVYDSNTGVPTQTPDGLGLIEGDYFVAGDSWSSFTKGETYKYTGVLWIPAGTDNPTMLLQALSAMKEQGVDFNNLNDPNTISWFTKIISDTVIAKTIKAIQGFFDSIYVTGNSQFDGNIFNEAFRTYKGSNGATLSFTTTTVDDFVYLSRNSVMSELGSYGTYTVTSGSITIKKNSSSTTYTYTATPSSPFSIVFTSADFRIVKLSDSTTVVKTNYYNSQYDGYQLINPTLTLCGITSNSLVLADVAASAEVSLLVPKNSNSSVGSASLPFPKGWFGSFNTLITGTGDSKTTGHCSLTNGLELKWGYINGTGNDGVYSFSHTYTSDEGGPFATTTLFAHAEVPVGTVACRVVTDVPGPSYNPEKKFEIKKYNLANTSTYTAGVFIRWFAIGY